MAPQARHPSQRSYRHVELFGGALEELGAAWRDQVRLSVPDRTARRAEMRARVLFENVTDEIREAARIPEACRLSPETLRAAGEYGLREILGDSLRRRGLRHLERLQELLQEDLPWVNRRP